MNFTDPARFFTNVAARLLKSELAQDFARIQIYPTNQYTPAVHRLLQVTANLYDATTNRNITGYPYMPSVFRPLFQKQGGTLFIAGYEEVTNVAVGDAVLNLPVEAKELTEDPTQPDGLVFAANVYNVPWIIGAKKGFPNFNELAMQNSILVARRLEFRHRFWTPNNDPNDPANPVDYTNQLYSISITNAYGIEAWNSYTNNFPRSLAVSGRNDLTVEFYGTNGAGQEVILASNLLSAVRATNISPNTWKGLSNDLDGNVIFPTSSFVIPLETNFVFLGTNYGFLQSSAGFDGVLGHFQNVGPNFPIPNWWVRLKSRVRFILFDDSAGVGSMRIVDYVSLSRDEEPVDVTYRLAGLVAVGNILDGSENGGWYTNRLGNSRSSPTVGILNQIFVCLGQIPVDWNSYIYDPGGWPDKSKGIQFFKINFGQLPPMGDLYKTNIFFAPFAPRRTIYQHITWQANDPLVHYMLPDVIDPSLNTVDYTPQYPAQGNLLNVNQRYRPWGATFRGQFSDQPSDLNPVNKDPLVYQSDNWQFPTNLFRDLSQIGQIHRGTPWQTIYLKSSDVDTNLDNQFWRSWTGNTDPADAARTRPVNDWHLASQLLSLLRTNNPYQLLSPNNPNTNAWLKALNGMVVLTNTLSSDPVRGDPLEFNQLIMTSNSPQAAFIANSVGLARNNQPNQRFRTAGDVLTTPELSIASPWLNLGGEQTVYGISDEAYEKIPAQLLLLLREDSIGSITKSNGQLLVQFTGYNDYPYAVQSSCNFVDWVNISTNHPTNGTFSLLVSPPTSKARFFRSALLP